MVGVTAPWVPSPPQPTTPNKTSELRHYPPNHRIARPSTYIYIYIVYIVYIWLQVGGGEASLASSWGLRCPYDLRQLMFSYSLFSIVYCLMSIVYFLLSLVFCLFSFVFCLLSIVYCLLPIAYCLLSIVYCLFCCLLFIV